MIRKYICVPLMMLLMMSMTSCEESEQPVSPSRGQAIAFQVVTPDTRAEVTESNLNDIILYGKRGDEVVFDNVKVNKPSGSSVWEPTPKQVWGEEGVVTHEFWAYTWNGPEGSIQIGNNGKELTVSQPSSYTENGFTDFLLSYRAFYKKEDAHNLVPLYLEHAFSKVNLYVTRAISMNEVEINDLKITFRNLATDVKMLCETHKERNDKMEGNDWSYSNTSGQATYEKRLANQDIVVEPTGPSMSFIAIPVDITGMQNYVLDISYSTRYQNETLNFTKSFPLSKFQQEWQSGYITRYNLLIDNGIHLTGSIKKWEEVDYIEGTILPPAVDEDEKTNQTENGQ